MNDLITSYSTEIVLLIAFLINIPLGILRCRAAKYSLSWFLWIHASIPIIVFLRIQWGVPLMIIPFSIAAAIAGQITGGWIYQRRADHA